MAKGPDKPPLTLVNPTSTGISPPRKLGEHGLSLWNAVMAEYRIDDRGGIELLAQCCAIGRPPRGSGWRGFHGD